MRIRYFYHASPNALPADPAELQLCIPAANGWKTGEIPDSPMLSGTLDERWGRYWAQLIEREKGEPCVIYQYELPEATRKAIRRLIAAWHLAWCKYHRQHDAEAAKRLASQYCEAEKRFGIQLQILPPDNNHVRGVSSWQVREVRFWHQPWLAEGKEVRQ